MLGLVALDRIKQEGGLRTSGERPVYFRGGGGREAGPPKPGPCSRQSPQIERECLDQSKGLSVNT